MSCRCVEFQPRSVWASYMNDMLAENWIWLDIYIIVGKWAFVGDKQQAMTYLSRVTVRPL